MNVWISQHNKVYKLVTVAAFLLWLIGSHDCRQRLVFLGGRREHRVGHSNELQPLETCHNLWLYKHVDSSLGFKIE